MKTAIQDRKKTIPTGKQYRDFEVVNRSKIDTEARTVELSFSSEEPAKRYWGTEILDHSKGAVRMARLKKAGPLLVDHNSTDIVGALNDISIDFSGDRKGHAVARFGQSVRANEVFQDVVDDIRRTVSVGYLIHKMLEDTDTGEFRAVDWEPLEVSLVAVPMDITVGVGRDFEDEFKGHVTQVEYRSMPPDENTTTTSTVVLPQNTDNTVDVTGERKDAAKLERDRITQIAATGKRYGMEELANKFIQENGSCEDFNAEVLRTLPSQEITPESAEVGLTEQERRDFSFIRLIRAQAAQKGVADFDKKHIKDAGFELECHRAVADINGDAQGLWVPYDVLRGTREQQQRMLQRDLQVAIGTAGGNLVAEEFLGASFIELLRNNMVTTQLGVRNLDGLVGDIAIPKHTGAATAYWVNEGGAPTESEQTIGQIGMTPKTLGAFTDFRRKLLLQSAIGIEQFVREDFAAIIGLEMDRVVIYGSGVAGEPKGITSWADVNTVTITTTSTPDWAEVVGCETEVATDNALMGSLGYATHPTVKGNMKTTSKAGTEAIFVMGEGNTLNGYPCAVSTQITSTHLLFGNWADALVGRWGGIDILVDPFTQSTTGTIRVVIFQSCDVAVRHGQSFTLGS